jgi:anti-sigma regulatory factor (Ser/Thr protein kinase)
LKAAREALVHLASDASSLIEGRRFVATTLRGWNVDEARIDPVVLVANELVANAIVHANSAPVLSLADTGSDLVLRVADESPDLPVARDAGPGDIGGRGLIVVDALVDRWGIDRHPGGKTVWAAFAAGSD